MDFTIITMDYKLFMDISKRLFFAQAQLQETSMFKHNCLRLSLAQGQLQETSYMLKVSPRDLSAQARRRETI